MEGATRQVIWTACQVVGDMVEPKVMVEVEGGVLREASTVAEAECTT